MSINFIGNIDNRNYLNIINEISMQINKASEQMKEAGDDIDITFSRLKKGLDGIKDKIGFRELVKQIVNTRDQFQQLEVSLKSFAGSEEEAESILQKLMDTSSRTPFSLDELGDGAKKLMGMGVSAGEVNDTLISLGTTAAGLSLPLEDAINFYCDTLSKAHIGTEELNEMMAAGIPVVTELSRQYGVAESKVMELAAAGQISGSDIRATFEAMSGADGIFGNALDDYSQTIGGRIDKIQTLIDGMFNEIGQSSEGLINVSLEATTAIVENWKSVLAILGDVAIAYGVQKAVVVGASVIAQSSYKAELDALSSLLPVKGDTINLDVTEALSKGKISQTIAKKVIAMRNEVNAYLENLASAKALAVEEAHLAAQKYRNALQASQASKVAVTAKRNELIASGEICGAYISEKAVKEMGIVTDNAKAASIQSISAKQEYQSAITNKKIATDVLDTATTNANTVSKNLNAKSTTILTVAKEGLINTSKNLYSVLASNPYGLIAAGVVALGYEIYKASTYQDDFQSSLKRLDERTKEYDEDVSKELTKVDTLFDALRNAKEGTEEWKNARDLIWQEYGQYLSALGDEETALKNVEVAYKLVREAALKAAKARILDKSLKEEDEKYVEDQAENYEKVKKIISAKYGEKFAQKNEQAIHDIVEGRSKVNKKFLESFNYIRTQSNSYGGSVSYQGNDLEAALGTAHRRNEDYNKTTKAYEEKFGISREEANGINNGINNGNKKESEKESNNDNKNLRKFSKATNVNVAETHRKLLDLMKQQAEDKMKQYVEFEMMVWQNKIDIMDEGEAKTLDQMKLNKKKEELALEDQKKQAIKAEIARQKEIWDAREAEIAAHDSKYQKKTFNGDLSDADNTLDHSAIDVILKRYEQLQAQLYEKQEKADKAYLQAVTDALNAYLKEYGSYSEKKLAIKQEYDKKLSKAQNQGERLQITAAYNKANADLDFKEWTEDGVLALAFGDIEKLSKNTIGNLITKMEQLRNSVVMTFDSDKIKKFDDALAKLRIAYATDSFWGSNEILSGMQERLSLQKLLAYAENDAAVLQNERDNAESELEEFYKSKQLPTNTDNPNSEDGKNNLSFSQKDEEHIARLEVKIRAAESALTASEQSCERLRSQLEKLGTIKFADIQKFSGKIQKASKNVAEFAGLFNDDVSKAISSATDKMGGLFEAIQELGSNIDTLAKSGKDIVDESADAAKKIVDGTSEGMKKTSDSTSNSLQAMEKASAIIAIIGAAIQLATLVASLADPDKNHDKKIENLQEQIDALQKSYDALGKAADEAFSTDASALIEQQDELLKQQKVLIEQQLAEEQAKKKSDDDKIKAYQEQLEKIDESLANNKNKAKEAILGEDVKSLINDFATLYAGAWDDGTDAAQKSMATVKNIIASAFTELLKKNIQPAAEAFYNYLADAMNDGILTDSELAQLDFLKSEIDSAAAEGEEQYKKITNRYKDLDELREELTDISFDSVCDNFKSLLADMEASTADFTDSFTDMLRNALIEGLMDNKYDSLLDEWYKEFAKAMEKGELSDSDRDNLRRKYDDIVQQGISDRNLINDIVGGGAYSQEASSGGWSTMGQDSADELNGRFTALTELEAINNSLVAEGNLIGRELLIAIQNLSAPSSVSSTDNPTLLAIRDMMFLSTGYLEDIAKYAKRLGNMESHLNNVEQILDKRL